MVRIKDKMKLEQLTKQLDVAMDLAQDSLELEDSELRKEHDIYAQIQEVINIIDDIKGEDDDC